jgi:hypothetical protein
MGRGDEAKLLRDFFFPRRKAMAQLPRAEDYPDHISVQSVLVSFMECDPSFGIFARSFGTYAALYPGHSVEKQEDVSANAWGKFVDPLMR